MTLPARPIGEDDLTAFVDGRLPADRADAVSAYLAEHPDHARRVADDEDLRRRLRERLLAGGDEPIPVRLRISSLRAERGLRRRRLVVQALAASLLLVAGLSCGWAARGLLDAAPVGRSAALAEAALTAHRTFAVEVVHPVEVKADQEKHLAQWLSRRIGRPLVIPDLSDLGLTLVGGRLLPAGRDPAAFLMYADATGARVTLYVRAGAGAGDHALHFLDEAPLAAYSWQDAGYGFAVSSAMERERLRAIAKAVTRDFEIEAARRASAL